MTFVVQHSFVKTKQWIVRCHGDFTLSYFNNVPRELLVILLSSTLFAHLIKLLFGYPLIEWLTYSFLD